MGKQIRNKKNIELGDSENEITEDITPTQGNIEKLALSNKIKLRLAANQGFNLSKQKKFQKRLINGKFASMLNEASFSCPICLELMIDPMTISCGHIFCHRCIESNMAFSSKCCICRQDQHDIPPISARMFENLIKEFILPTSPEALRYLCKITDSVEWLKRRKSVNIKLNLVIDFRDGQGIWRKGVISSIEDSNEIEVRYRIQGVDNFQKIKSTSPRIAPFTFFTRGKYKLDFMPKLSVFNPIEKELNRPQYCKIQEQQNLLSFKQDSSSNDAEQEQKDQMLQLFDFEMRANDILLNF